MNDRTFFPSWAFNLGDGRVQLDQERVQSELLKAEEIFRRLGSRKSQSDETNKQDSNN